MEKKVAQTSVGRPDPAVGWLLLSNALGAADANFVTGLLGQLAYASSHHGLNERNLNFMLAVIKNVQPRDQLEAMLAAQMAAVHMATMTFAHRLAHVENIPQQDSAERALNKLARTYATQIQTLKRYRTGGEQKVTVQHVSVSEGGQAILGNVTHTARQSVPEEAPKSLPDTADTRQVPMRSIGEREPRAAALRRTPKK